MLTKAQKKVLVEEGKKLLEESKSVLFLDFTGADVETTKQLRRLVKGEGGAMKVLKKRLLRVAFQEAGIDFNPEQFESQLATIFTPKEVSEIVSPVYKFAKAKAAGNKNGGMQLLGAYDLSARAFVGAEQVKAIGELPSREVLLGQLVGMLAAPIRAFLYVLSEKSKMVEAK